tara:strand:+ start:1987 stop:2904 length:918 start_codon:yes stop_codon:yes gene_type:complete
VEDYLTELAQNNETIKTSTLLEFSGISGEELEDFCNIWKNIPGSIKVKILTRLNELAEFDVQLDFTNICKASLSDAEPIVRKAALDGLWELQDRTFIKPLISILLDDSDSEVRSAAAISLSSFARLNQNGKLINRDAKKIFDALIEIVEKEGENYNVLRRTIEAIGYFYDNRVDDILNRFHRSENPLLRQSAIFAMGRNSKQKWLNLILKDLRDENPAIRFESLNALGFLGDESTVSEIIPFTKDPDIQIKIAALTSLGYLGGELAKREILTWTEDDDENIREVAISALTNIDFEEDPLGLRFSE